MKTILSLCKRNRILILIISITVVFPMTSSDLTYRLDSLFNSLYEKSLPGASILIAKNGEILYENYYGIQDLETNAEITASSRFNIASISKQFTVASILLLQERGLLNINDKIIKHLPYLDKRVFGKVTIKHLMSHSSGIPDFRPRTDRNWMLKVTDQESVGYLTSVKQLKFEPGTQYDYINPTFQILFLIIEKLSNQDFVDFQQKNIFNKVNMNNSYYFDATKHIEGTAHGYILEESQNNEEKDVVKSNVYNSNGYLDSKGRKWHEYDYGEETFFATKADGGIYSTVNDLLKWNQALFENKIISKKSVNQAFEQHTKVSGSRFSNYQNRPDTYYGLGFFIENKIDMPLKVYHTGDNGGFQAYSGMFPEEKVSVILLENRNDLNRWETVQKIDRILKEEGII